MSMQRLLSFTLVAAVAMLMLIAPGCAAPAAPQKVVETVEVEKEVPDRPSGYDVLAG